MEVTTSASRTDRVIKILEEAGAQVRKDAEKLYLRHPYLRSKDAHQVSLERAKRLVLSLNFLIQRLHVTHARVELKDLVGICSDGSKAFFATAHDGIVMSCDVDVEVRDSHGNIIDPPKLPTAQWQNLLLEDENVATVCELMSHIPQGWNDLYRALEIIADDVGGNHKLTEYGWLTKDSLRRFRHTANSPASIGLEARHGVDQADPPATPMMHAEAAALLDTIVYQWLELKASKSLRAGP